MLYFIQSCCSFMFLIFTCKEMECRRLNIFVVLRGNDIAFFAGTAVSVAVAASGAGAVHVGVVDVEKAGVLGGGAVGFGLFFVVGVVNAVGNEHVFRGVVGEVEIVCLNAMIWNFYAPVVFVQGQSFVVVGCDHLHVFPGNVSGEKDIHFSVCGAVEYQTDLVFELAEVEVRRFKGLEHLDDCGFFSQVTKLAFQGVCVGFEGAADDLTQLVRESFKAKQGFFTARFRNFCRFIFR